MITKKQLEKTVNLDDAISKIFGVQMDGRTIALNYESMEGVVALEYNLLGQNHRSATYQRIVEDFKNKSNCYAERYVDLNVGTIIDVGCGSGLLSFELAEQTNGTIYGIDSSKDMIANAKRNLYIRQKSDSIININFKNVSVYDLASSKIPPANYIVCRNALHRFLKPKEALEEMYAHLNPGGIIYIRDLRRDAPWDIIKKRIGDARYNSKSLVEDYVGAMAAMFIPSELECLLDECKIADYKILSGSYDCARFPSQKNLNEYEKEAEYVCLIRK